MNNEEYFPTPTENLKINTMPNFNIYIQIHDHLILFHKKTLPLTKNVIEKLLETKIDVIHISEDDAEEFEKYNYLIQKNMIISDTKH